MSVPVLLAHSQPARSAVLSWLIAHDPALGPLTFVTTGEDAISQIDDAEVALVDLLLQGTNAIQTVQELRRLHPDLLILVLGSEVPYLRAAAKAAGADKFLGDRLTGEQVLTVLRLALAARNDRTAKPPGR